MQLYYNARKAAQAAAYLVRLNGGQMDLWRMLKLLYLSDRESLVRRGTPITSDRLSSMPFGPTPSRTYDNTKVNRNPLAKDTVWKEFLTENEDGKNEIRLVRDDFSTEQLSQFEQELIRETFQRYAGMSMNALSRHVHGLPEYKDPQGSSFDIDPEDILRQGGWSDEEISDADRNAHRERYLHIICK
jgi:uncharacterized phage-associated protein